MGLNMFDDPLLVILLW